MIEIRLKINDMKKLIYFNVIYEIPLKRNLTKKTVHQKIEIDFNFIKEIPFKYIRNKKK